MPAPPELGDGARGIGQAEILRVFEAEDAAHADGHIGIAGKIEIDLKGIEHDAEPGRGGRRRGGAAVQDLRGDLARGVSQQDLFGKADAEAGRAVECVSGVKAARVDLPGDVGIADDRPGDELREERDVEQKFCKRPLRRDIPAPDVDRVGKRLEGIKRDADGQRDDRHGDRRAEQRVQVFHHEARIFEDREAPEVQHQRQHKKHALVPLFDQQPEAPVDRRGGDHQKQVDRLAPGVEDQAEDDQHRIFRRNAAAEEIRRQTQRQEQI